MESIFWMICGAFALALIQEANGIFAKSEDDQFESVKRRLREFYVLKPLEGRAGYNVYKKDDLSFVGFYSFSDLIHLDANI